MPLADPCWKNSYSRCLKQKGNDEGRTVGTSERKCSRKSTQMGHLPLTACRKRIYYMAERKIVKPLDNLGDFVDKWERQRHLFGSEVSILQSKWCNLLPADCDKSHTDIVDPRATTEKISQARHSKTPLKKSRWNPTVFHVRHRTQIDYNHSNVEPGSVSKSVTLPSYTVFLWKSLQFQGSGHIIRWIKKGNRRIIRMLTKQQE